MSRPTSRPPTALLLGAALGAAGLVATYFAEGPVRFFSNWVTGFLFLLTVGLGSFFIVTLEHTVASTWSVPLRRVSERLTGLVVWTAPLGVIALLALPVIYPWTQPEAAQNPIIAGKLGWLSISAFVTRAGISFVLWFLAYRFLVGGSIRQDETKDPAFTVKARRFAPAILVLFAFSLTMAAFDWISSLEPIWYSDIFGVYLFAGTFLAGLASAILAVGYLCRQNRLPGVRPDHVVNLSGYLFAFTIFWSYIAFAQYMLQWYANMPEEVFWYAKRIHGFWQWYVIVMAIVHFVIPFLVLASRKAKTNLKVAGSMAILVLFAHYLDLFWLIFPARNSDTVPSWPELASLLFFACLGVLWARWSMSKGEDMPVGDPLLESALKFRL